MLTLTSAEMNTWIAGFLWPLTRILGLMAAAPLFGSISVPVRVKVILGALTALVVAPTVPALPAADPMSWAGMSALTQELVIGLSMGFVMRMVISAAELAGELIGMTMGLGFATFYDPQSQGHSSAIAQFLSLLTLMIYLATNLHLVLLAGVADSFSTLPISATPMGTGSFEQVVEWGGRIFSAGVQLSMPVIAALLVANMALGILTRAAPQLNLFGIGFPITISVGFVMIALTMSYLAAPTENLFNQAMKIAQRVATPSSPSARQPLFVPNVQGPIPGP